MFNSKTDAFVCASQEVNAHVRFHYLFITKRQRCVVSLAYWQSHLGYKNRESEARKSPYIEKITDCLVSEVILKSVLC